MTPDGRALDTIPAQSRGRLLTDGGRERAGSTEVPDAIADQIEQGLSEHSEAHITEDGGGGFTVTAMLDVLKKLHVPPEQRPHVVSLASFSSPARHVSVDRLHRRDPDEPYEPTVIIRTTPEELRAFASAHTRWEIEQKLDKQELVRVPEGYELNDRTHEGER